MKKFVLPVKRLLLTACCLLLLAAGARPQTGSLCIRVTGVEPQDGAVLFSLYDRAEDFPDEDRAIYREGRVYPVRGSEVLYCFDRLPYGTYAVAVMHDEDGDGEMDYNWIGYPVEQYGFSNNPAIRFSAPSFRQCAVQLDKPKVVIEIRL